jgi:hypothetical protein
MAEQAFALLPKSYGLLAGTSTFLRIGDHLFWRHSGG